MRIVFLSDTFDEIVPFQRIEQWCHQLPIGGDDKVTLYFFDYVVANLSNDDFLGGVMYSLDNADVIVACGPESIEQMECEGRKFFRMPDLVTGNHEKVYIRSLLNTLGIVIDTIRGKMI